MSFKKLIRLSAKTADELENGKYSVSFDAKPLSSVNAISLKTLTFCNNVYNVLDGENELTFNAISGATDITPSITVPEGQYTVAQLMDVLKTLIDVELLPVTGSITFSLNPITYKIEYVAVGFDSLQFLESSTIKNIIGFENDTGLLPIDSFLNIPNLNGLTSVTVNIKSKNPMTILNKSSTESLYTNSIGVVPVNVIFGFVQTYSQNDLNDASLIYTHPTTFDDIQFQLRDQVGRLIKNQKEDLVIELMIYYQNN